MKAYKVKLEKKIAERVERVARKKDKPLDSIVCTALEEYLGICQKPENPAKPVKTKNVRSSNSAKSKKAMAAKSAKPQKSMARKSANNKKPISTKLSKPTKVSLTVHKSEKKACRLRGGPQKRTSTQPGRQPFPRVGRVANDGRAARLKS